MNIFARVACECRHIAPYEEQLTSIYEWTTLGNVLQCACFFVRAMKTYIIRRSWIYAHFGVNYIYAAYIIRYGCDMNYEFRVFPERASRVSNIRQIIRI